MQTPKIKTLAVTGSRNFADTQKAYALIAYIVKLHDCAQICTGANQGAESLATHFAQAKDIPFTTVSADWLQHGKAAEHEKQKTLAQKASIAIVFLAHDTTNKECASALQKLIRSRKDTYIYNEATQKTTLFTFEKYSNELIEKLPNHLFLFGDNLLQSGTAGQAVIRHHERAFGIPTKRKPTMEYSAFFSDKEDEKNAVRERLQQFASKMEQERMCAVYPMGLIGTGLAKMPEYSPETFLELHTSLAKKLGFPVEALESNLEFASVISAQHPFQVRQLLAELSQEVSQTTEQPTLF